MALAADLCDATGMMEDDVVATLDQLGFIVRRRPDIQLSIHMTVVVSVLLTWKARQTAEVRRCRIATRPSWLAHTNVFD
jgi:hypothetical protein